MGPPLPASPGNNIIISSGSGSATTIIVNSSSGGTTTTTTNSTMSGVHLPSIRLRRVGSMRPPVSYRPPRVFPATKQQQAQQLSWRTARLGLQPAVKQGKENNSNSSSANNSNSSNSCGNNNIAKASSTLRSFPRLACGPQGRLFKGNGGYEQRPQQQQKLKETPTPRSSKTNAEVRPAPCATSAGTAAAAARRQPCRGPTFEAPGVARHDCGAGGDDADGEEMGDAESDEIDEVQYLDGQQEERIMEWLRDVESCLRNGCSRAWSSPLESEDTSIKIVYGAS